MGDQGDDAPTRWRKLRRMAVQVCKRLAPAIVIREVLNHLHNL